MKYFIWYIVHFALYLGIAEFWHWLNPEIPFWSCCGVVALSFIASSDARRLVNKMNKSNE